MAGSENIPTGDNQNASRCALCGGPNQCALGADPLATECWCDTVEFPDGLLGMVPTAAKRKICICQQCLTNYQRSTKSM